MKILTELQERVLSIIFGIENIRRHFYLTGGTALSAYYLKHRYSDDLDIFTHSMSIEYIDREVVDTLTQNGLNLLAERSSPTFRRYRINNLLQLDLVRDVDYRIGAPELIDGIMVDTKKNIATNKVTAIYGRLDPKDYVDIFFLLKEKEFDILELLNLSKNKDAGIEPFQWSKVITDAETISILPRMIIPCDLADLKKFFRNLRDTIIDSLKKK